MRWAGFLGSELDLRVIRPYVKTREELRAESANLSDSWELNP